MINDYDYPRSGATDDFQKSRKNAIFENCIKNLSFEKNEMFDDF